MLTCASIVCVFVCVCVLFYFCRVREEISREANDLRLASIVFVRVRVRFVLFLPLERNVT